MCLNAIELIPSVIAASDSRLVSDHHHRHTHFVGLSYGFRCTWNQHHIFATVQVIRLLNKDSVTIEKETRFARMVRCGQSAAE